MILDDGRSHLTYCTNIHPGEDWEEVQAALRTHLLAVKRLVAPQNSFGIGLRLSAQAARQLDSGDELEKFRDFLRIHDLYLFTINGFPHGAFHGEAVKEKVYLPDWRDEERVRYTRQLATILAALLPDGPAATGSISTVPGAFHTAAQDPQASAQIGRNLGRMAAWLWRLQQDKGVVLGLALEPEPHCLVETTEEAVAFFQTVAYGREALAGCAADSGIDIAHCEPLLRAHLGICLDACHAAVEFENPQFAPRRFAAAGIPVFKLQVSTGLRLISPDAAQLDALRPFAEGVYLHQTVIRHGERLERFVDLPEALARRSADPGDEWRVHFHVPLFRDELSGFHNTQPFLRELLAEQARAPFTSHLEVETYTWDVLPIEFRREPVEEAIARELIWTLQALRPKATPR